MIRRAGTTTLVAALVAIYGAICGAGCQDDATPAATAADPVDDLAPPDVGTVAYRLTWSDDGVRWADDGSFDVTTDLGYDVHVDLGWVVSYSAEIVECPGASTTGAWLRARLRGLVEGTAWAGHSALGVNEAAMPTSVVEDLLHPDPIEQIASGFEPITYCGVHYLVGRADIDTIHMPDAVDMDRISVHVEGSWSRDGAGPTAFVLHSSTANGLVEDLYLRGTWRDPSVEPRAVDLADVGVRVHIERDLASLFDGVDFATLSADNMARDTVQALVDHTRLELTVSPSP